MTREEKENLLREAVDILIRLDNHLMTSRENAEFSAWVEDLMDASIPQFDAVPMSVIDDIKAEIEKVGYAKDEYGDIRADVLRVGQVLKIIEKHTSGGDTNADSN